jgi:type VI secretion system protein ImpK
MAVTPVAPMRAVPPSGVSRRRGQLALSIQEILTAAARIRSGHQIPPDAQAFRNNVLRLVRAVDEEGRKAGYSSPDVRYALYAVIAFVDETVLNSGHAGFDGWAMRPLQEEIFGKQVAGEAFFQYLNQLLARDDSEDLADVLEVYLLCLLLGFRGRYATAASDVVSAVIDRVGGRVDRIRGPRGDLAPDWAPGDDPETAPLRGDPWLRRLALLAATLGTAWLVLLLLFSVLLRSVPGTRTAERSARTSTAVATEVTT